MFSSDVRSALLEAVVLVASATIVLADVAERGLEAVGVLHAGVGLFRIFAELGELGLEVGHVFPNLGTGVEFVGGVAALGAVGKQRRHLRRRILECRKHLMHRRRIKRLLP